MVLNYRGKLPEGVLLRTAKAPTALPATPVPQADIWLDASAGITRTEAGRVTGWASRGSIPAQALPVPDNANGTGYRSDPPALQFAAGENGGLRLSGAVADGTCVTLALILTPGLPDARSLLSLQPVAHEDYVFLSLEGPQVRLARKDAVTGLSLTLPTDAQKPLLVLCAVGSGMARMSINGGPVVSAPLAAEEGPADLFIGCRTARKGMKNKLGRFDLSDVMVWPGQDLLGAKAGFAAVTALWNDRCRLGL